MSGDIRVEVSLAELEALIVLERAARRVQADTGLPSVDSTCDVEAALQALDGIREAALRASGTAPPAAVVPIRRHR
jgi:hypothetical protein